MPGLGSLSYRSHLVADDFVIFAAILKTHCATVMLCLMVVGDLGIRAIYTGPAIEKGV